jgi:hypothetical protein
MRTLQIAKMPGARALRPLPLGVAFVAPTNAQLNHIRTPYQFWDGSAAPLSLFVNDMYSICTHILKKLSLCQEDFRFSLLQ